MTTIFSSQLSARREEEVGVMSGMTSLTVIGANMAADSNMNFHMGMLPSSLHSSSHVLSFQPEALTSSSLLFPIDSSGGISCAPVMALAESPGGISNVSTVSQSGSSYGNLLNQMTGLKADTWFASEWSHNEQFLLEAGLLKCANESNMMKYIKIASSLRMKTVRDVALRCRWMSNMENGKRHKADEYYSGKKMKDRKKMENGKRCRADEYYSGKKMKDRKDNVVDSSLLANVCQPVNMVSYSFTRPHFDHSTRFSSEVPVIDGATQCLIEENNLLFRQIEENLDKFKLQDNINLLYHSRNNIASILYSMRVTPGIMSQMSPLPIGINTELANTILPNMNQQRMFGVHGGNC